MKKRDKVLAFMSVGFGAVAAVAGVAGASFKLAERVIHPNPIDYHEHYKLEIREGRLDEDWFHRVTKEEFNIPSYFGYDLHGFYFPRQTKKTAIVIHGINAGLWSSVKYGRMFYEKGYNVIIYSHRNHGLSGGDFTSLGVFEKMDGKRMVELAMEKDGKDIIIGVHGESMGAATAMMLAGVAPEVDFVIEDCGFTSAYEELKVRLKEDHNLPSFPFLFLSNIMTRRLFGFDFKSESPLESVSGLDVPMLFIHGGEDGYVPTDMVNDLFNAKKDKKEIKVFPGSDHATSFVDHTDEYKQVVYDFLDKYGF